MARYLFHIQDGVQLADEEGVALDGIDSARSKALKVLMEAAAVREREVWTEHTLAVRVTDDDGLTLLTVTLLANEAPAMGSRLRLMK